MNNQDYALGVLKSLLGDSKTQQQFQTTLLEQRHAMRSHRQKALSGLGRQMVKWGSTLQGIAVSYEDPPPNGINLEIQRSH